jgi:hypothetical protein
MAGEDDLERRRRATDTPMPPPPQGEELERELRERKQRRAVDNGTPATSLPQGPATDVGEREP